MRKVILLAITTLSLALFSLGTVFAQNVVTDPACEVGGASNSTYCQQNGSNPVVGKDSVITRIINLISLVAGAAAVVMIVISGFMFVSSQGESAGVSSARKTLMYAIVGLVIVIFAQAIVRFVLKNI